MIARLARQRVGGKHRLTLGQFGSGKGNGLPRKQSRVGPRDFRPRLRLGHQPAARSIVESCGIGRCAPFLAQDPVIDVALGLARVECGNLLFCCTGIVPGLAPLGKPGLDRSGTLAERIGCCLWNSGNLEGRILAALDGIAKPGDAMGQFLPIDRANILLKLVDRSRLQAAPRAFPILRRVEHHGMGVKLRILRATGVMPERGNRQIAGCFTINASSIPDARCRHVFFDMGQGHFGRGRVGGDQPFVPRDLGHDRDRLGGGERDIPPGSMFDLAIARGAELFAGDPPLQHGAELLAIDFARKAKLFRAFAEPFRWGKAAFGVVVIGLVIAGGLAGAG